MNLEFWGFRLLYWRCWGGRPGIGPTWANMVQNTTKAGIFAIFGGQKWPSSSYLEWSGAYSNATPCTSWQQISTNIALQDLRERNFAFFSKNYAQKNVIAVKKAILDFWASDVFSMRE